MEKTYYLPISSASLAHYFGSACLAPSKYFPNKPYSVQDIASNKLIITGFLGSKDCDCCLEIVLTETEISELEHVNNEVFSISKPLPISRVKMIFFNSENQKQQTISNIELSTAFIPKNIVSVNENFGDFDLSTLSYANKEFNIDYSEQISYYDRLLGGFSLMKFSGEEYMNYSQNYFSTLSFFNGVIKQELIASQKNISTIYHDLFKGETSFKVLNKYLFKQTTEDDLAEIANIEKQNIIKDSITKIIDINKLEKASYIVAILNTYGTGNEARKKKIDGLILSNFKAEISPEKSEVVSLCYGINRGYSSFNNSYKYQNKVKEVKFKLETQLDYYTIECLYQFAFNKIESDSFTYLDSWCPKQKIEKPSKKSNYLVLDVEVVEMRVEPVISDKYLSKLLLKLFQKDTANLVKDFIKQIRDKVYEDTLKEVQEQVEEKENEEIRKSPSYKNQRLEVKEPNETYSNNQDFNENVLLNALELKGLPLSEFKKVAKMSGIIIPSKNYEDKRDRDKYIIQIVKSNQKRLI